MRLLETQRLRGAVLVSACHTDLGDAPGRGAYQSMYARPMSEPLGTIAAPGTLGASVFLMFFSIHFDLFMATWSRPTEEWSTISDNAGGARGLLSPVV